MIKTETMLFVTGTGTEVGKTIVSAILVKAMGAYYWKPVQAGIEPATDTETVQMLSGLDKSFFLPEAYQLKTPASPHYAAAVEGIEIEVEKIRLPETGGLLVVEGAGGMMVPLKTGFLFRDLMKQLNLPVVLVAAYYLGAINHTILSLEALKFSDIPIAAVVLNGNWENQAETFVRNHYPEIHFLNVPFNENPDAAFVEHQAKLLTETEGFKKLKHEVDRKR